MEGRSLHSIEFFGLARRYWWNVDFLELMSRRWNLAGVRLALEVGSGVGHWSAVLSMFLPQPAHLIGIDREPEWVNIANAVAEQSGRNSRFQVGLAESLEFPDETFDLVTCQTLLVHVKDPVIVLGEMKRVLKPGGLLVISEPNNLVQPLCFGSTDDLDDIERMLNRVRLVLTCSLGKRRLGEGHFSIGELVPGLLSECGFRSIEVYQSDKTHPFVPPYETEEQSTMTSGILAAEGDLNFWIWPKADAERYFLAGDGTQEKFEAIWSQLEDDCRSERQAIGAKTFYRAGGKIFYLINARKEA